MNFSKRLESTVQLIKHYSVLYKVPINLMCSNQVICVLSNHLINNRLTLLYCSGI